MFEHLGECDSLYLFFRSKLEPHCVARLQSQAITSIRVKTQLIIFNSKNFTLTRCQSALVRFFLSRTSFGKFVSWKTLNRQLHCKAYTGQQNLPPKEKNSNGKII